MSEEKEEYGKICPFMSNTDSNILCEEKDCGLWNIDKSQCCFVSIAQVLNKIEQQGGM
jgi:hypothetical protein